jgi:hypothetical protein
MRLGNIDYHKALIIDQVCIIRRHIDIPGLAAIIIKEADFNRIGRAGDINNMQALIPLGYVSILPADKDGIGLADWGNTAGTGNYR